MLTRLILNQSGFYIVFRTPGQAASEIRCEQAFPWPWARGFASGSSIDFNRARRRTGTQYRIWVANS